MKRFGVLFFLLVTSLLASAQAIQADSLKKRLAVAKDTLRVNIMNQLAEQYLSQADAAQQSKKDTLLHLAFEYATAAEAYARQINYIKGIGIALYNTGNININAGKKNFSAVLSDYLAALPFLKAAGDERHLADCLVSTGDSYHMVGNPTKAIAYYDSSQTVYLQLKDTISSVYSLGMKGHCYYDIGDYKKAYELGNSTLKIAEQIHDSTSMVFAMSHLANLFLGADLPQITVGYMRKILLLYPSALDPTDPTPLSGRTYWGLMKGGEAFLKLNQVDSAVMISKK